DQANLSFRDTIVPRIGVDFRVNDTLTVRAGVAMEDAVLDSDRSLDVNYLDNDRLVVGLGASAEFRDPWIFAFPVRVDVGYQMHVLKDRKFDLTSSQVNNGQPYETLETSGDVHVFAGSLTLKF
ncbi:MAG TPA: outer membrane protein transport protein, partial [Candidatus Kapabacteria bacterium]|nr:outer membrane protein transport protein [Candidatus Kapabacteria bacterium]